MVRSEPQWLAEADWVAAPDTLDDGQALVTRDANGEQRLVARPGLEERGFIRRLPAKDRAIEVVKPVSRFTTFALTRRARVATRRRRKTGLAWFGLFSDFFPGTPIAGRG